MRFDVERCGNWNIPSYELLKRILQYILLEELKKEAFSFSAPSLNLSKDKSEVSSVPISDRKLTVSIMDLPDTVRPDILYATIPESIYAQAYNKSLYYRRTRPMQLGRKGTIIECA